MACGIVGTPAATVDHWAARARLLKALTTRLAQVICPSGGLLTAVSSPLCKNISVFTPPKSHLEPWASHPTRGALAIVTNAGRDAVDAAASGAQRDAGLVERLVSDQTAS